MLCDRRKRQGRKYDLQPEPQDQDAVAKRIRHVLRYSQRLSGVVTHDQQKCGDVLNSSQPLDIAEAKCYHTVSPAKRARRSSTTKHHESCSLSSPDTAVCTNQRHTSEPIIKSHVSTGAVIRVMGRVGKRRSNSTWQSVSWLLSCDIICCIIHIVFSYLVCHSVYAEHARMSPSLSVSLSIKRRSVKIVELGLCKF